MTHRFHPLSGRDFEFVAHRQNWGEDRVHLHDENGVLFSLPAGWTDVAAADPFVVIADGRCPFTTGGLLALADLIDRLGSQPDSDEAVKRITSVKQPSRIVAAYNDSGGVSAAFARNALNVINNVLGGNFKTDLFRYLVEWNTAEEQLETYLEATAGQRVFIRDIALRIDLSLGDRIQTEISAKFRRERLESELKGSGLRTVEWWTDRDGDFGVALAVKD